MIYALWEILVPLLLAFLLGVLLGWFIWRWRRTKVTHSEWSRLQDRAEAGDRAAEAPRGFADVSGEQTSAEVTRLRADLEICDIEIEQLRAARDQAQSQAEAAASIAPAEPVASAATSTEAAAATSAIAASPGNGPSNWTIKGNVDSMKYHRPDSRNYGATVAEAWFETPEMAEAAGFTLANTHPKSPADGAEDDTSVDAGSVARGFASSGGADVVGERHPFGPGSHGPLTDDSQPDGYVIKGNVDSMLYHRADSRNWGATVAEVWFDSAERAEAAGFTLARTHPKS